MSPHIQTLKSKVIEIHLILQPHPPKWSSHISTYSCPFFHSCLTLQRTETASFIYSLWMDTSSSQPLAISTVMQGEACPVSLAQEGRPPGGGIARSQGMM